MTPTKTETSTDALAAARPLVVVLGLALIALSGLAWGARGMLSAAAGSLLSVLNVWGLQRLALRAVRQATAGGPDDAAGALTAGLLFKTIGLFAAVWLLMRSVALEPLPFGLGLLLTVFSLLAAGLWVARKAE